MAVRDSVDVSQDVPTKHINHQPSSIDSCPRVSTLQQSLIPPSVDFVSHDKQPKYNSRSTRGHSIVAGPDETISRRRQRTPACLDLFSDAIQRRKRRTSALDTFGRYRGSMSEQGYFNRVRDDLVGLLKVRCFVR